MKIMGDMKSTGLLSEGCEDWMTQKKKLPALQNIGTSAH